MAVATAVGAAIALLRVPLQGALGSASPFILASPAIMVAAFIGGLWPALIVGVLALWVGDHALIEGGAPLPRPAGIAIYFAFTGVFAAAGEMRRRGLARAKADAVRLAEMQDRLAKVARLNAMGEMAGALAHELNQPLTAIASYAGAAQRLVQRQDSEPAVVVDLLDKVSGQAVRAREIIGRLRGFVGRGEVALAPQSLSAMVPEAVAVALAGAKAAPSVRTEIDPAADQVLADRVQLQQVMVNLVRNAAEAMAGGGRREIRIGARPAEGGMVEVFVADSGPGLAPEVAERLFQPFVTGKADGMGIGLAVSRSIVEAHGGEIRAGADPAGGAVFTFTLRRAAQDSPP